MLIMLLSVLILSIEAKNLAKDIKELKPNEELRDFLLRGYE